MEGLGERLLELLQNNGGGGDNSEDQQQQQQQQGTIEISERSTTTFLESADDETSLVAATTSALQALGRSYADDLPRLLYQEDAAVVAAAAAAAAVKFRTNYMPPIGVFWDIENCQVRPVALWFEMQCYWGAFMGVFFFLISSDL